MNNKYQNRKSERGVISAALTLVLVLAAASAGFGLMSLSSPPLKISVGVQGETGKKLDEAAVLAVQAARKLYAMNHMPASNDLHIRESRMYQAKTQPAMMVVFRNAVRSLNLQIDTHDGVRSKMIEAAANKPAVRLPSDSQPAVYLSPPQIVADLGAVSELANPVNEVTEKEWQQITHTMANATMAAQLKDDPVYAEAGNRFADKAAEGARSSFVQSYVHVMRRFEQIQKASASAGEPFQ